MADNVAITPGSGASIATDDVGGVQYQRVKLDLGGDGASSPLLRGQQAKANSLPVVLASDHDAVPVSDGGGALTVDGTVTVQDGGNSVTIDNAALESLVLAEDAVHVTGDKGVMALAVRSDAGTVFAADGDYMPLSLNGSGALRVVTIANNTAVGAASHDQAVSGNPLLAGGYASAAAPADVSTDGDAVRAWHLRNGAQATVITAAGALIGGDASNGLDVDVTRLPNVTLAAGTNTNEVVGDAAHDAAIAGNPVRVGGRALSADYSAVSSGDAADLICDLNGKQIVMPYALPQNFVAGVTSAMTGTSDTSVIASGGAGIRNYVTAMTVTNSHASVGTVVELKDGSTVIHRGYAAPNGGGYSVNFPVPLRGTAATAINAANITTGSNTYVSASGFRAP